MDVVAQRAVEVNVQQTPAGAYGEMVDIGTGG